MWLTAQSERFELVELLHSTAPSTYYAHVAKRTDPEKLSARARRDIARQSEISRVFKAHFEVYGVKKVWYQMVRERFDIARCTVARLMRGMGLAGVTRGKSVKTTVQDKAVPCPLDHVNRNFKAPAPNVLRSPTSHTSAPGQGWFMWHS